jgi:hypothetical protein
MKKKKNKSVVGEPSGRPPTTETRGGAGCAGGTRANLVVACESQTSVPIKVMNVSDKILVPLRVVTNIK